MVVRPELTSGLPRRQALWLLGDAITCPVQLAEPAWHSFGDVDPELAEHSRRRLWRELSRPFSTGVGAHFRALFPAGWSRWARISNGRGENDSALALAAFAEVAEDAGFEPARALTQPAFQASAIGH